MGVVGIGLAVVAGVEEPHAGGELGWYVHHVLAGFEEPLGEWTPSTIGSLDCPDSTRPGLAVARIEA